ncbi:SRPBCC family protein [Amycolatopsis sp. NPDC088138]|uniref:SRPBCC family protein n=1 Tax=Amycolatopsis sp. NPDC088138 TaxID=3363938 RepID=UPI00381DDA19
MRLDHEFTVPAPIGEVWQAVVDPERVAPCMPGASLTKVEGDRFSGTVKVKLGPISLLYKGNGEFLEKDDAAHKVTIKASGKDSRGAGTAAATVTLTLTEAEGGTHGTVATDLSITGKPAQFGRGLISEVGGKILDTFAGCLSGKLAPSDASKPAAAAAAAPAAAPAPAPAAKPSAAAVPGTEKAPATPASAATPAAATASAAGSAPAPAAEKTAGSAAKPAPASTPEAAGSAAKPASPPAAEKASAAKAATSAAATSTPVAKAEPAVKPAPTTAEINTEPKPAVERPALHSVPAVPETEAIDLLDYAGASVLKRLAPVVLGIAAIVGLVAIIRALRK